MAKVSNLKIQKQSGNDNTYFATWEFNENTKTTTTTSSSIKKGSLVSIKSSATTWYNGVAIPSWVKQQKWYVVEIRGTRVVLGQNESKTNNIMSPIHSSNLTGGSSGSSGSTTTNTLDHYTVSWTYDTGDGVWFTGNDSDVKVKQSTYSAPEGAIRIKVGVKPVAKKHKVNGKDTSYWSGSWVSTRYSLDVDPPEVPPTPTVEIEKYKLTAKVENISDARSDQIQFEVLNGTKVVNTATVTVVTAMASYSCNVDAGGEYRVRARAVNLYGSSKNYSEWTDYTSSIGTIPSTPSGITSIRATSETSIYLAWSSVDSADTYDIEYATEERYLDGSNNTSTQTGIEGTHYEITGLESGNEYFFRVRATNDQGSSGWTEIKSVVIGEKPSAPTTWSSTTTAIVGEPLNLYWVHNSEDNSKVRYAELEIYFGDNKEEHTIQGDEDDDDEEDRTYSYAVDTTDWPEGTVIRWRVRTAGITLQYGDWSIMRTIDIYAPPTLTLSMTDVDGATIETLQSFPFTISGLAGPNTQEPIGYHISITSNSAYETVDTVGRSVLITEGQEVYSRYLDIKDPLSLTLSASDIDLENNITYTITVVVSMNSGLTATQSIEFTVAWEDVAYEPDAEISVDTETLVAFVRPYVVGEDGYLVEGVSLAVYRREFDGTFTEIASGLDNATNTVVTDPHPSLDYARYRIVATDDATGSISYYDCPGWPVGESGIILQWDEEWSNFNILNEAEMEDPPWAGSFLRLPYNINVSDNHAPDVSLVEYAGRSYPVSYYGTQLGSTSSWSTEIPKTDTETLYALRRLAIWPGDVYVREPSGSGYWANITISFSQKYSDLTIPITIDISRVEGGM